MTALNVIVPTRSRPHNVAPIIEAWGATDAFTNDAELFFVLDADDPRCAEYQQEIAEHDFTNGAAVHSIIAPRWHPLVPKLNSVARDLAVNSSTPQAFMGDDHLPRSQGWVWRISSSLKEMETGIVYGDDGYHGENLPTSWAMTSDIVRVLRGQVPADVDHLFCDNAILRLGQEAECISYLPDVKIEHMHPVAHKADWDLQYQMVNSASRYQRDGLAYSEWVTAQLSSDAEKIRALRSGNG